MYPTAGAEAAHSSGPRIAVPPGGLGRRHAQIIAWFDENCGSDGWAITPSGIRGVLNDVISLYFADAMLASAFAARRCVGTKVETLRTCSWSGRVSRRRGLRQCLIGYRNCGRSSPDQRRCFLSEFICPPSQPPALFNEVFGLVTCARGLLSKFGKLVEIIAGNPRHKYHSGQSSVEPALIWVNFYSRANPGWPHPGQPSELKSLRSVTQALICCRSNAVQQKTQLFDCAENLDGLAAPRRAPI